MTYQNIKYLNYPVVGVLSNNIYAINNGIVIDNILISNSNDLLLEITKLEEEIYILRNLPELLALPEKKMFLIDNSRLLFRKDLTLKIPIFTVDYAEDEYVEINGVLVPIMFKSEIPLYIKIALIDGTYFHIGYSQKKLNIEKKF